MEPGRPARLVDVAQRAGVAPSTASVVLNGKAERIPEATRQRVIAAAEELHYQANAAARSLRTQRSMTLALISDEIVTQPFAGALVKGAQEAAWTERYVLVVAETMGNPDRVRQTIEELTYRQLDGLIFGAMFHQVITPPSVPAETPMVLVDARDARGIVPGVVPDEVQGAYDAVGLLIAAGHERIGFLQNFTDIPATSLRMEGYARALKDAGLPIDPSLIAETVPEHKSVSMERTISLLDQPDPPTALFCFSDRAAAGAYAAARALDLSIPEDLSIVGFDNLELIAGWQEPGLTTMQLPHEAMGRLAVEMLIRRINDPSAPVRSRLVPCPVVERDSIAPPRTRPPV